MTVILAPKGRSIFFLVASLVISLVLAMVLLLQIFMSSLLERDASLLGMRWAESVEKNIDNLEEMFAGKQRSPETVSMLKHISLVGQIYRYEFLNPNGYMAYSTGYFVPNDHSLEKKKYRGGARHSGEKPHVTRNIFKPIVSHNSHESDAAHTGHFHDAQASHKDAHQAHILDGDGVSNPHHYAKIIHPVYDDGTLLGTITLYMDQSETQALLRDTMLSLFVILVVMTTIGFALPAVFYLRGRTAAKKAHQQVQFFAMHDAMTKLYNRRSFIETVDQILRDSEEDGVIHALHFIDLDNFKPINDTFGHDAGDELLRGISAQMLEKVSDKHTLARIGGDEFAVLQFDAKDDADIKRFAYKLQMIFSDHYEIGGRDTSVSASIGTAVAPRDGGTCKALMKCADLALYSVKAGGRNGEMVFEPGMMQVLNERIELENSLKTALAEGRFTLNFQPLFSTGDVKLSGFEALLRMRNRAGALVSPEEFIPVAEEIGMMEGLGSWVVREATRIAADWPQDLVLAVNLSITQFESGNLASIVAQALADSGLSADRLEMEITEGMILKNTDWNIAQLHELKQLGTMVVMDDFGTGYSSLGYLWSFPFDKLKIDRSFLTRFDDDRVKAREIIQTIISLGHSLDMKVTAEGVETEDQLTMLGELNCDYLQGYYLGKPFPAEQIAPFLLKDLRAKIEAKIGPVLAAVTA